MKSFVRLGLVWAAFQGAAFAQDAPRAGTSSTCAPTSCTATACETTACAAPAGASCPPATCAPTAAAACATACVSPTGSTSCGTGARIPAEPVSTLAERTGPGAEDLGLTDLEPMLEPIRAVFHVPGLGAAVLRDGSLAAIGTAGIRRVGSSQRLEIEDPFHLGSCGKAVTATVAAILVERGDVAWSDAIGRSFPEFGPTMHPLYRDVSLQQLLAHRGGFPARGASFDAAVASFAGSVTQQRSDLVRYALAGVPAYEPGGGFVYSDIGYSVGGTMLGRSTGRPWEELVDTQLAQPLALRSLGFGAPGSDDPETAPRGHVLRDGELVALGVGPGEDLANPAIGPAGTIHMNLRDWATFATLHLRGARGEDTALLSADAFAVLHADVHGQGYGLGWFVTTNSWGEGRALTHTGSCGAWSALIWILPEQNAAILVAANVGGSSGYQALQLAAAQLGERYVRHE